MPPFLRDPDWPLFGEFACVRMRGPAREIMTLALELCDDS